MEPGKKLSLTSGPKKVEGWGRRLEGKAGPSRVQYVLSVLSK